MNNTYNPDTYQEQVKLDMARYDRFDLYLAETGWENWMEGFCDDPEDPKERELLEIEDFQSKIWKEVHKEQTP